MSDRKNAPGVNKKVKKEKVPIVFTRRDVATTDTGMVSAISIEGVVGPDDRSWPKTSVSVSDFNIDYDTIPLPY